MLDYYIKNVETALAELKKAMERESIKNQKEKPDEQIHIEKPIRF